MSAPPDVLHHLLPGCGAEQILELLLLRHVGGVPRQGGEEGLPGGDSLRLLAGAKGVRQVTHKLTTKKS